MIINLIFTIYLISNVMILFYYAFWSLDKRKIYKLSDLEIIDLIACFAFPLLGVIILVAGTLSFIFNYIVDFAIKLLSKNEYISNQDNKKYTLNELWKQSKLYKTLHRKIRR